MTFDTGLISTIVMAIAGVGVWSLRQEGRINGHDSMFAEREKLITSQIYHLQATAIQRHEDTQNRLDRIEAKLDRLPWGMSTK